jgi:hypothetical protein
MEIADELLQKITDIIQHRQDVIKLACSQRSKFEHWLKFELAAAIAQSYGANNILIEPPYPTGGKADLSLQAKKQTWYVELKTSNTNWRAEGVENKIRPITMNINNIILDIHKLREKSQPSRGIMAFILFPVPLRIWHDEREKLIRHLDRIEEQCNLAAGSLVKQSNFLQVAPSYGILAFVVEAN